MQDYVLFMYTASRSLKTHHSCILWLRSTFVIYVVLYPYHMMYSNILNIASSDMTLYMTLLCICFGYYLCSIGFLSPLKINIIMYFGHRFPLTSHIREHLLSTQMALLHPSADISYVGAQKDIYGLKVA